MARKPEEKKKVWLPPPGGIIPAHLPNEIVLARVVSYKDDDTLEACLDVRPPLAKSHNYHFRSKVTLKRRKMPSSGECWAVPDEVDHL